MRLISTAAIAIGALFHAFLLPVVHAFPSKIPSSRRMQLKRVSTTPLNVETTVESSEPPNPSLSTKTDANSAALMQSCAMTELHEIAELVYLELSLE
eukprot:CAMPEP_0172452918 /NCGR_PEP_ID=MMETSP1065-20121228/10448_1 /TAXON_ID=265537 /ORGANISM="Amphiprora paludosa, Strain CCMP125" /LENGTH=96 /DNA_ID=CAMNT_0013205063 /DNA_START=145 /DNA_END=435 /DNA_ORIENTATION=-